MSHGQNVSPILFAQNFVWLFITIGSSTFGEVFNPARDCSDIVDHLPGAQDGFYWIVLNNKTKHKVLHSLKFCTPINIFPIIVL